MFLGQRNRFFQKQEEIFAFFERIVYSANVQIVATMGALSSKKLYRVSNEYILYFPFGKYKYLFIRKLCQKSADIVLLSH
jgi:hypothetical protein